MIQSRGSQFEVTCEGPGCGVIEEHDCATFQDFIDTIKAAGWKITKDSMGWHHYCSEQCKEMPF